MTNKPPQHYFELIKNQISEGNHLLSGISSENEMIENLNANCIPLEIMDMTINDYPNFLEVRRKLMAEKMKEYYFSL